MKKLIAFLAVTFFVFKIHPSIFNSYQKKSPEENVQDLAIEQINNPTDPYINYNIGVALYQTQKYEAAKNNFERALAYTTSTKLKERSFFNLANSCYKNALSALPINWEDEKTQIDPEKLEKVIGETKNSIKNYEILIELDKENLMAKTNLKKAKELLEKLNKKQQQQKQNQKQDKQDKKNDRQQDQDQQNQNNSSKDRSEHQQEQKSQKTEKQEDQNKSQDSTNQNDQGEKQKPENQQTQSDQKQGSQHNQKSSEKQDPQEEDNTNKQQDQAQESSEQMQQIAVSQVKNGEEDEKESAEKKVMRLMLENLQHDEENLQKAIIQRQTKDQKPLESEQKPW